MQILIELSEEAYNKLTQKSMLMSASAIDEAVDAVKHGNILYRNEKISQIDILNGARNKEVLTCLFPNAEVTEREEHGYKYIYFTPDMDGESWRIHEDFWNARYEPNNEQTRS